MLIKGAGVLFVANEKILLVEKKDTKKFELPGGHVEEGEDPSETAVREVKEELGYDIPLGAPIKWSILTPYHGGGDYKTYCIVLKDEFEPKLQTEELSGWRWASADDMEDLPLTDPTKIVIKRLYADVTQVAEEVAKGTVASPAKIFNRWLFALKIIGTGHAVRIGKGKDGGDEYTLRKPEDWQTDKVLRMCMGLKVTLEHPENTQIASPEFIEERQVGEIILPYFKDGDIWGVAVITNPEVAKAMAEKELSTSPGVLTGRGTVDDRLNKDTVTVETSPLHLDHIAICKSGIWDKQGDPVGIDSPANRRRELMKNNTRSKMDKEAEEEDNKVRLNKVDLEEALEEIPNEPEENALSKEPEASEKDADVNPEKNQLSPELVEAAKKFAKEAFLNNRDLEHVSETLYKEMGIPNDQAQTIASEVKEAMSKEPEKKEGEGAPVAPATENKDPERKDSDVEARALAKKAFDRGDKAETVKEEIRKMCPELSAEQIDKITAEADAAASGSKLDSGEGDKEALRKATNLAKSLMEACADENGSMDHGYVRSCLSNVGFDEKVVDEAMKGAMGSKQDADREELREKLLKMDADLAKEREQNKSLCAKMDALEQQLPAKLNDEEQNELAETVSQMDSALAAAGLPSFKTMWSDNAETVRNRFIEMNKKFSPFYKDEDVASYTPKQKQRAISEIISDMAKSAMSVLPSGGKKPPIKKADGTVIHRDSMLDVLEQTGF